MVHIEEIRVRAYYLWLDNGQPVGTELADWLEAERSIFAPEAVIAVMEPAQAFVAPAVKAVDRKAAAKHNEAVAELNHAIDAAAEPKKAPKGRKKVAVPV